MSRIRAVLWLLLVRASRLVSLLACSLVLFGCRGQQGGSIDALIVETVVGIRPYCARYSMARRYVRCDCRSGDEAPRFGDQPAVFHRKRARRRLLSRLRGLSRLAESDLSTIHARAMVQLAVEDPDWDAGIKLLEAAVRFGAGSALEKDLRNDLAVALFARGVHDSHLGDIDRALEEIEMVTSDGKRPQPTALFNRAVILRYLRLGDAAQSAWDEYLRVDPSSPWAGEARQGMVLSAPASAAERWIQADLGRLEEALARGDAHMVRVLAERHRWQVREQGERHMLLDWAEAIVEPDAELASSISVRLGIVGRALADLGGDRLLADVAQQIEASNSRHRMQLAAGVRALDEGYIRYKDYDAERAQTSLRRAQRLLEQAGSPLALSAAYFAACSAYRLGQFERARRELEALATTHADQRYPSLAGHVQWMRGLLSMVRADPALGLRHYRRAREHFVTAGEVERVAVMDSLIGDALNYLGQTGRAWRSHRQALSMAAVRGESDSIYFPLSMLSDMTLRRGWLMVALHFQEAALDFADKNRGDLDYVESLSWRAAILQRRGRSEAAMTQLAHARRLVGAHEDAVVRARTLADLDLVTGMALVETKPNEAQVVLSAAYGYFQSNAHDPLALIALHQRARTHLALGDLDGAERDLEAALEIRVAMTSRDAAEDERLAFLSDVENLDDESIRLQAVARARPRRALALAEAARARRAPRLILTENSAMALGDSLSVDAIQRQLGEGTRIIYYTVLDERLLSWCIGAGQVAMRDQTVTRGRLAATIDVLHTGERSFVIGAEALYGWLIQPWRQEIRNVETLIIVPDKDLNRVPFAALRDPETGHFVIDDHRVVLAPSASYAALALASTEARLGDDPGPKRSLVVGDPAFNPELFGGEGERLQASAAQARALSRALPDSTLLQGVGATPSMFFELAPRSRWIHYAGHALINDRQPLLSLLALAPDDADDGTGALYARDIYRMKLDGTRLVVLAACRSAGGGRLGVDGPSSLARAFLAAGCWHGHRVALGRRRQRHSAFVLAFLHRARRWRRPSSGTTPGATISESGRTATIGTADLGGVRGHRRRMIRTFRNQRRPIAAHAVYLPCCFLGSVCVRPQPADRAVRSLFEG